jgi:hypothetical protein
LPKIGITLSFIAALVSLLNYILKSWQMCYFSAGLWGIAQTFMQINTGGLVATVFPGRV